MEAVIAVVVAVLVWLVYGRDAVRNTGAQNARMTPAEKAKLCQPPQGVEQD